MCGSRGGVGRRVQSPPLEFAKLDIAYITENEKLVIFHITSTVIRQTESIHKITIK